MLNFKEILVYLGRLVIFTPLVAVSLAQTPAEPSLRIISPANGAVVRPGQKVALKLAGVGDYIVLEVVGEVGAEVLRSPVGKPPWTILLEIPMNTDPGKTAITAGGVTSSGVEIYSKPIEVDVEPVDIPQLTFSPPNLSIPMGECVALSNDSPCELRLEVYGTFGDGTRVRLDGSSRITFTSESPAIARVTQNGKSLAGISVGSTELVVSGKYKVKVAVTSPRR